MRVFVLENEARNTCNAYQSRTESTMSIMFTCENCGKQFKVDERSQGKRGRCSVCHQVMRIPGAGVAEQAHVQAPPRAAEPAADLPFKLSPPEPHPVAHQLIVPGLSEPAPAHPVPVE